MKAFAREFDDKLPIPDRQYEAWAIWNSCQGVFTCSVRHWRSECVGILKDYGPDAKIVPVMVVVDEPDDWWRRHIDQDEWERLQKQATEPAE